MKKAITFVLILCTAVALFCGCNKSKERLNGINEAQSSSSAPSGAEEQPENYGGKTESGNNNYENVNADGKAQDMDTPLKNSSSAQSKANNSSESGKTAESSGSGASEKENSSSNEKESNSSKNEDGKTESKENKENKETMSGWSKWQ